MPERVSRYMIDVIPHLNSAFREVIEEGALDQFLVILIIVYSKPIFLIQINISVVIAAIVVVDSFSNHILLLWCCLWSHLIGFHDRLDQRSLIINLVSFENILEFFFFYFFFLIFQLIT
jgi:hypothetical protein